MHVQWEENPFPAIGNAAYRKYVGGGLSHRHRQHAQRFGKDRASEPHGIFTKFFVHFACCGTILEIYGLSMGKKTPSRQSAMRPIVSMSKEDQATVTGNMHKKI